MLKKIRTWFLPALALASVVFALVNVLKAQQSPPPPKPPIEPSQSPFSKTVAGAGIVEPRSENISIGAPIPGVVAQVLVQSGQRVRAGDPLFRIDDRPLRADLKTKEANLLAARAQLERLEKMPRTEEIPVSEARRNEAKARLAEQEDTFGRNQRLFERKAIPREELVKSQQMFLAAREQYAQRQAEHALLLAGAWSPDKRVAEAAVEQAAAAVEQVRTELERLTVRASVDGTVLQVNVRPGEFVGAPPTRELILLGELDALHVRVDIDEHDIPRFRAGAPARATVRGSAQKEYRLRFVRVEPFVVPKKSLTGDNTERVDTRVLQVIYAIEPGGDPLYVGQQVDVYVDLTDTDEGVAAAPGAGAVGAP